MVLKRFLEYVKINTQSDENSETFPTTACQFDLARFLKDEMEKMGIKNVILDEYGYVYGEIESNIEEEVPTIGFIAHMDTSPDLTGENVNPRVIENYDGEDIVLNEEYTMKISDFPELKSYKGKTMVVTDGTTIDSGSYDIWPGKSQQCQ